MRPRFEKIVNDINEYFSSAWVLLSDTTIWLSNNRRLFTQYESQLRELRHRLESSRGDLETIREIRKDIAQIRKTLRLQGYNLKMGSIDLKLEGFRNDDAIVKGFRRCVLYLMEDGDVIYITGLENHLELDAGLEARLTNTGYRPVSQKHYLWYQWINRVLVLSGSATETAEDFEEFREYVKENKNHLLRKLKKI